MRWNLTDAILSAAVAALQVYVRALWKSVKSMRSQLVKLNLISKDTP